MLNGKKGIPNVYFNLKNSLLGTSIIFSQDSLFKKAFQNKFNCLQLLSKEVCKFYARSDCKSVLVGCE